MVWSTAYRVFVHGHVVRMLIGDVTGEHEPVLHGLLSFFSKPGRGYNIIVSDNQPKLLG